MCSSEDATGQGQAGGPVPEELAASHDLGPPSMARVEPEPGVIERDRRGDAGSDDALHSQAQREQTLGDGREVDANRSA